MAGFDIDRATAALRDTGARVCLCQQLGLRREDSGGCLCGIGDTKQLDLCDHDRLGTAGHEAATGAKFVPVLYQGDRQAIADLMGGHIDVSYGYFGTYRGLMESGKIVPIGVASPERMPLLPQTPTFNEVAGVDDIVWDAFRFVVVPKGVDPARKRWLEAAFNAALSDPAIAAEFAALGAAVDRRLGSASLVAQEVERRANRERAWYVKTGRLK
jgi:tripartite-type tricarboxylate transporter receptor subunit TctC